MSTVIRPELSKSSKYWIDRHRYYELKHFCLQYPIWKKAAQLLDALSKSPSLLEEYIDYSGPLAHPGRSLAQLDRASAHSTRSAVQPMLAADQHTC